MSISLFHKNRDGVIQLNLNSYKSAIIIIFFTAILLIGLAVYKDYGISWDEETNRNNGLLSYNYIIKKDQTLLTYRDRDYGVAFELPLIILERIFKPKEIRNIFYMRHLATFFLFFISLVVYYFLCKSIFNDWKISLLGSLFLVMSPRIFAHSFYNSKDLPFLSFYLISSFTLIRFLDTKSVHAACLHGFACAVLIDIRIIGIIVPCLTLIFLIFDSAQHSKLENSKKMLLTILIYFIVLFGCIYLFWPYLWQHPIHNFVQAVLNMSKFRENSDLLYMGKYISPSHLPWHYLPVWMLITTPILYVIFFFAGIIASFKVFTSGNSIFKMKNQERNDLIILSLFFLPFSIVILLHPVLYDSWRHFFFIYPIFLILALRGLHPVFKFIKHRFTGKLYVTILLLIIIMISLQLINVCVFMIKFHPHQNVYFSALADTDTKFNKMQFERDYWGLSYKQAFEFLLQNDNDQKINIFTPNPMGRINTNIFCQSDRDRLHIVTDIRKAKYFVGNFRWQMEYKISDNEYLSVFFNLYKKAWYTIQLPINDEIFSINIDGLKIITIYDLAHSDIRLFKKPVR